MPIYEYVCRACGAQSEITHRMADPPATHCPVCAEPALTKQVSAPAFRLKGGGWYETDFKQDGKRNLAGEGETKDASQPEAKAETKPESKTETKPEAKSAPAPAASSPAAAP